MAPKAVKTMSLQFVYGIIIVIQMMNLVQEIMLSTTEKIKEEAQAVVETVKGNQNVGMVERIFSGVAAVALGAYAVKKKDSLVGKGLTALSGFLLTRATTGFCPLNKAIGRNTLLTS